MNRNELHGGAVYLGGKAEKAIGDAVDSRDWQVDGVAHQVAGAAENLYGRARSVAEDVADAAPGIAVEAREKLGDAAERASHAAKRGGRRVAEAAGDNAALWTAAAAAAGYALAWLIHRRRG